MAAAGAEGVLAGPPETAGPGRAGQEKTAARHGLSFTDGVETPDPNPINLVNWCF